MTDLPPAPAGPDTMRAWALIRAYIVSADDAFNVILEESQADAKATALTAVGTVLDWLRDREPDTLARLNTELQEAIRQQLGLS